jgi:eukaryotic-like serine/threonine-protein kinase
VSNVAQKKDELTPGTTFGRHTIVRRIGSGGMGAVYEATHTQLKKRVAIKVLHAAAGQSADVVTRFIREGEAAARIHHPHVVDIYDIGEEAGTVFLAMEYLEGEDLSGFLKREGTISAKRVAEIMLPVCAAISAAHDEKVIHRDLKPANIFLAKGRGHDVVPKVLDFGISKILHEQQSGDLTSSGALLGTPYYMSPEQARGSKVVTAASDQYSLGVILYQCVTGEKPFFADSMYQVLHSIVQGKFDPPRAKRPDLPEALEQVILKAMANRAEDRYPSVIHLGQALLPFAGDRARALWEPTFASSAVITAPGHTLALGPVDAAEAAAPRLPRTETLPPVAQAAAYAEPISSNSNTQQHSGMTGVIAPPTSRKLLIGAVSAVIAALGVLVFVALRGQGAVDAPLVVTPIEAPQAPTPPTPYRASTTVSPGTATIEIDGTRVRAEAGRIERTFARDGTEHRLRVSAVGYESQSVVFKDAAPPDRIELVKLTPPPAETPQAAAAKALPQAPKAKTKAREPRGPGRGANDAPILR